FGMGSHRVIQGETSCGCQNTEDKERRKDADETGASGQHRNDLISARHATEKEKERQQKGYRQENHQNLWDLGGVKFQDPPESKVQVEKGRNAVADIEDQPDRNETHDAVKISLQKVSGDISIK